MRKNEEEQGTRLLLYGKAVLLGGAAAFLLCLALLFLASLGIAQGLLDTAHSTQLCMAVCFLGSLAGGWLAVKLSPGRSLFVGIAAGAVLFHFQLTAGFIFCDAINLENGTLGLLCGALCGGAVAGILNTGKKGRRGKGKIRRRH